MISLALANSLNAKISTASADKQQFLQIAWEQYRPVHRGSPFKQVPDLEAFTTPGELNEDFAMDATNFIKFIRLTADIDSNITVENDLSEKAQWGVNLLRLNGNLDHRVPKPKELTMDQYALASQGTAQSNISKFYGRRTDLVEMIHLQLIDDRSNVWNVGHRRWLLNPFLKKVGLGFSQSGQIPTSFGAIVTTDQSGSRENPPDFVAWPSQNAFPIEFTTQSLPWSVTLNPAEFQKPIANQIKIQLTNLTTNQSWKFQPQDNNVRQTDTDFKANYCGRKYGFGPTLLFRPDNTNQYTEDGQYEVKIVGLLSKEGEPKTIQFKTRLFKLGTPVLLHQSPLERSGS
jgi:hypothetical protein